MTDRVSNREATLVFPHSVSRKTACNNSHELGEDENRPGQNRFSVHLRPSELLRKFNLNHSHELRPGDIFDQIFFCCAGEIFEISARVPSAVLVIKKSEIDEIFATIRSSKDTRLLKQFTDAFNLPSHRFYSEKLCHFVANAKVT